MKYLHKLSYSQTLSSHSFWEISTLKKILKTRKVFLINSRSNSPDLITKTFSRLSQGALTSKIW